MRFIFLSILFFISFSIQSQSNQNTRCEYDAWLAEYEEENPGYSDQILQSLKDFRQKKISEKRSSALITVPVHVILVHSPGQAEGTGTNFTLEHVQSQIDVINQDFGFYNSDAGGVPAQFPAGDTGIQFCLASVDPDGNATDGVTRYGTNTSMANGTGRTEVISATRWPREEYMNIWSAPNLPFLGLASLPTTSSVPNNPNQDFILVASSTFGGPGYGTNSPYNLGRTTTHEIGHWFGLPHIWGNGCGADDGISDTPNQSGSNFGCPNHPSPSCTNSGDMFMNYMDYVNDACMFSFSIGQGEYMNTILSTSRASLQGSAATACAFVVPLTLNVLDQQNPKCSDSNDGHVLVEAEGGSPNYSYSIDGGTLTNDGLFTDLPGGSHTIEVFDADGITTSITIFLDSPLQLVATTVITATNPCPDQTMAEVTIQTSGGTNPYFYSLNLGANQSTNTFDELANGFYSYIVTDDNGCTFEGLFEITGSDEINITSTIATDATCFGSDNGTIIVEAEGGTGSLTFNLNGNDNQDTGVFTDLENGDYQVIITDEEGCIDSAAITIDQPSEIILDININDLLCNGSNDGEVTILATGGNSQEYAYALNEEEQNNNNFAGLGAGTYTATAIDSLGCTGEESIEINEPELLIAVVANTTDVSCTNIQNGTAEINTNGGTTPYIYVLNGDTLTMSTISSLSQGNYSITVIDDNECSMDLDFDIGYSPAFQIETQTTNITCAEANDGIVVIMTDLPMGEATFSLDGGVSQSEPEFNNLQAGDYEVIVSNNSGCEVASSFTITAPNELINTVNIKSDVSCFGGNDGEVEFITTGGTGPYAYDMQTTENLSAGEYNINVTDQNGCVANSTFMITEPELLELSFSYESSVLILSGKGGIEPYEYSFDGGNTYNLENSFETTSSEIQVAIKDGNDCITTETILISSVKNISDNWVINAYPTPFTDIFNIELNFHESLDASVQIFDLNGKIVHNISSKKYQSGENFVKIDASNFASSIYIIKIASAEGYRYIKVTKM